jgi:hypothetical protein
MSNEDTGDIPRGTAAQYTAIMAELTRLRGERPANPLPIPLIDPTANVTAQLGGAVLRLDDLRINDRIWRDRLDNQTEKWRDKLDAERVRADALALKAEAGRLDALLLANTSNVALALGKQEGTTLAQDRRIATLEANQYQSGGANQQRTVERSQGNVDRSLLVSIVGIIVGAGAAYLALHH